MATTYKCIGCNSNTKIYDKKNCLCENCYNETFLILQEEIDACWQEFDEGLDDHYNMDFWL